ncbi:hypothetical protein G6F40_016587 [Rhizopus arrhizus]|nr:hypothetical protein G6F40_016587 [Rhizopus arrhizus]
MDQHEHQAAFAQPEPQQGQRQQGDSRQRVEHGGQRGQQVAADARGYRQRGQHERERDAGQIPLHQHAQRLSGARRQLAIGDALHKSLRRLPRARQPQVIVASTCTG